jgi:hypothetical protein
MCFQPELAVNLVVTQPEVRRAGQDHVDAGVRQPPQLLHGVTDDDLVP